MSIRHKEEILMLRLAVTVSAVALLFSADLHALTTTPRSGGVILDENSAWRRYYRFGHNYYSPAALRSEGPQIVQAKQLQKIRQDTVQNLRSQGIDPNKVDWRDHVVVRRSGGYRAFDPVTAPMPPADWTSPDFDDAAWVRVRLRKGLTGPLTLSLWQGEAFTFCVGTHVIDAHRPARFLSLRRRGNYSMRWRMPDGPEQSVKLKAGPSAKTVELPLATPLEPAP